MNQILDFFSGKKTYVLSAATFVVGGLWALGYLDGETAAKAGLLLGSTTLASLRAGMAKTEAKAEEAVQRVAALQRGDRTYSA